MSSLSTVPKWLTTPVQLILLHKKDVPNSGPMRHCRHVPVAGITALMIKMISM